MSTIRAIYHVKAPEFPATDQHPDAVRYTVRSVYLGRNVVVDALGGKPSGAEVDAVLNPPKPQRTQSLEERVLIGKGLATKEDFEAEAQKG